MTHSSSALFILLSDSMGGTERVTRNLAREAARSGRFKSVQILVLCGIRNGTLDDLESRYGIALQYCGARRISAIVMSILRKVAGQKYGLVFSSISHINAILSLARRLRLLRTCMLITRESTMVFERDFGWRSLLVRPLVHAYGGQNLIICQTQAMRTSFNQHTGYRFEKITHVIPNPIDMDMIEAGRAEVPPVALTSIPDGRTLLVWCGRLEPVKSPERAVDTLAVLHTSGRRDMHLVMIGDGSLRSELEQKAKSADLSNHVTFLGRHPLPSAIMAKCDMGLLTSNIEGFPNVVLEMLASGVSHVITTDCAGDLGDVPGLSLVPVTTLVVENLAEAVLIADASPADPAIAEHLAERTATGFFKRMLAVVTEVSTNIYPQLTKTQ